jgi:hypothetical protein
MRCDVDDALETLRAVPVWYEELLGLPGLEGGDAALYERTSSRPWSAVDVVVHVSETLSDAATAIGATAGGRSRGRAPVGPSASASPAVVALAALSSQCDALVDAAVEVRRLETSGDSPSVPLSAVPQVLRRAAHEAVHHGRELQLAGGHASRPSQAAGTVG